MALTQEPSLLAMGATAKGPAVPLSDIIPALPVDQPGKIICDGPNYVDRVKEGGYDIPDYPALFMR